MRTVKTLEALADARALAILAALVERPLDQAAIREVVEEATGASLGQSAASELMSTLTKRGLVRKASRVSPYELTFPTEVKALLTAAAKLADAVDAVDQRFESFVRQKAGVSGAALHVLPPPGRAAGPPSE